MSAELNFGVIIPTFNNDRTLEKVLLSTLEYTANIIVVNDGSTDRTGAILERYRGKIDILTHARNLGKGAALRSGLKRAEELGYEFAITLDSDGQHFPADIPKFLEKAISGRDILVIGNRNMTAESIPKSSKFGRKFSNFWVKLETGRELMDTQSGYRLYTVSKINRFRFFTVKYDFELESLIRWVWRDYPVEIVPVDVCYPTQEERVSHFRRFEDNLRISLLNTVLVTLSLFYFWPGHLIRVAFRKIKKASREMRSNRVGHGNGDRARLTRAGD
ncbi:MAG: glycosyltransferase family 2 protein [Patescibacteria group bacterium]